jgi:signal recognition particle receptor subunit beta
VHRDFEKREVTLKVVYYGPALAGKSTNLQTLFARAPPNDSKHQGPSLIPHSFHLTWVPSGLGKLDDFFRIRLHLATAPAATYKSAHRSLISQGLDAMVLVLDSQAERLRDNRDEMAEVFRELESYRYELPKIPKVAQFNKRDLSNAVPVDEMRQALGLSDVPCFEAVATTGKGVFDTLKATVRQVIVQARQSRS